MEEEFATAETVKELTKSRGLRRYIWIYFLLVPLAASTASAVAIIIAALQGLAGHEFASRIYAMTLLIGFKAIALIGAAYIAGLLLALVTASSIRLRAEHNEARTRQLRQSNFFERDLLEREYHRFVQRQNRLSELMVPGAVAYSAGILTIGVYFYLWQDVQKVWRLVSDIAHPVSIESNEQPISTAVEEGQP